MPCGVDRQTPGGTIDWRLPICNPNNGLDWDIFVPDSQVTRLGDAWTEKTKLEYSAGRRNQRFAIAEGLRCSDGISS